MFTKDISILFVEDDENIRTEISRYLQECHFKNVYVAENGKNGIECYIKHKPDLVLTDLTMPVMDGLKMSKEIKSINEDVPIILITSLFEKEITETAVDIGIDAYLFKPISTTRLRLLLDKYIKRIL